MTKQWFKSKTLWFNILTGVVFVATYYFGYEPSDVTTHNLTEIVTSPIFITAVNFVLRLITKKPVAITPVSPDVTIDSLP